MNTNQSTHCYQSPGLHQASASYNTISFGNSEYSYDEEIKQFDSKSFYEVLRVE